MDYTCLQTLNITGINNDDVLETNLRISKCAPFEFLALYEAKGLDKKFDGILGLSPKKNESMNKLHLLWALREYGLIERGIVSFSITRNDMKPELPYALFGGFNST